MPTKPTIIKRARHWAGTLSPSLWSLLGLAKVKRAAGGALPPKPGTSTASASSPVPALHPQQHGSPAAARQTSSTSAVATRDPDAELLNGTPAVLAARGRERTRCEAIMTSPAGQANPAMALRLAFETRTPAAEALTLLASTPPPPNRAAISAARVARNPQVGAGGEIHRSREQMLAARWDRTMSAALPSSMRPDSKTE